MTFYTLTSDPTLRHIYTHQCTDSSILLTDSEPHPSIPGLIGYVTSSGLASIIEFNLDILSKAISNETEPEHWKDFVKHHHSFPCADEGFEAWTLAFVVPTSSSAEGEQRKVGVYTGADDSTLRRLDFVLGAQAESTKPLSSQDGDSDNESADDEDTQVAELKMLDRRSHNAGVVAILPLIPDPQHADSTGEGGEKGEFILTLSLIHI